MSNETTKYRAEVTGIRETRWSSNGKEFDSIEEAQKWLDDLSGRWFGYDMSRVVPIDTPKHEAINPATDNLYQNMRK